MALQPPAEVDSSRQRRIDHVTDGPLLDRESKGAESESSSIPRQMALNSNTEITYLYLTFQTDLPAANLTAYSSQSHPRSLPKQPDLTPFIDPHLWPDRRKYLMLTLSCLSTFLTAYTAGSYSPPTPLMVIDLGAPSNLSVEAGITTFCIGFALAPMVLAPFSEINGRYPVFVASGFVYVVFQAVCGLVTTVTGMLVARLLVGVGGSVFSTMVGGVIADLWDKGGRNTPMAIFSGSVFVGTGAGPLVAAVLTERFGHGNVSGLGAAWKWVFWHQVIMSTIVIGALALLFKESRGSVLLSRKAKMLNHWYEALEDSGLYGAWVDWGRLEVASEATTFHCAGPGGVVDEEKDGVNPNSRRESPLRRGLQRIRWVVREDEERSSIGKMISISVYRPFHLLVTEPVVFFFSLWVAFAWAVLYLTFGSIPLVFSLQYGWDTEKSGFVFVAMISGALLSTPIGIWQDRILKHSKWQPSAGGRGSDPDINRLPASGDHYDESSRGWSSKCSSKLWYLLRTRFPSIGPESRLYFTCITSMLLPAGMFIFGFTSRPDIPWIAPAVAITLATMGIYSVYLAAFNYLADTYHKYASSALAAQSCCRNLLGGAFPLVVGFLFRNLGNAAAGGLLGAVGTALTIVPWVLAFYGQRIRARSPFARVSAYI